MKGIRNIIVIVLVIVILSIALEACKERQTAAPQLSDPNHATIEVTLPNGRTEQKQSYNGSGMRSGEELCVETPVKVRMKYGDTIDVTFRCDDCNKLFQAEINRAGTYYLCCNCPEDGVGTGRYREYVCLIVETT